MIQPGQSTFSITEHSDPAGPEAPLLWDFQLLKPVNSPCMLNQFGLASVSCGESSGIKQFERMEEMQHFCFVSILNQLPLAF